MSDFLIRPWREADRPRLLSLWQDAFGDSEAYIRAFHSLFLGRDSCLVAEAEGQAVAAMYILDGPLLFPPSDTALSSAYLYALATDPVWRGHGIGTAVFRACVTAALQRQDAACVLPADESLTHFYRMAGGVVPVSYVREGRVAAEELSRQPERIAVPISMGEYYLRRKSLLRGTPYAVMPGSFLRMEATTMEMFGGGFFSVDGDILAAEMDDGLCRVKELLAPGGDWKEVLEAVAMHLPAREYEVRTPLVLEGPGQVRPYMTAVFRSTVSDPTSGKLWWGFAFD